MDAESIVSQVQRRIELQSPDDLAYLLANVRRAAAARLDEAFPHVDGGDGDDDDGLRNQIAALVDEYIDKTFTLAAPNLSINGLAVPDHQLRTTTSSSGPSPPSAVYEPFDARKRHRVADLIAAEEKLLEEVAALKRAVPAAAAADHAARVRDATARDDALVDQRLAREAADAAAAAAALSVPDLERQHAVEAGFRGAVDVLGRLKRDMPAVVAKMERARVAGEYVITEGR
ncbi:kinetochore protein mis14 like domain-containing protein [Hirsutella rhossiliensis]|uniref:Kinetochore protein mis14 like domain-containing protein n=1 Tax=Hirsutella rhossiliensis TaxID=111463 RepID=A0A9P8N0I1_9HYPO|nr:kinetochore protein mis14 like domain-containing protein [Hirsutella rhossiliensis]KAH0964652.1 kinetochore protein mis14 like domain-containing protein [Hirsutella rhossiliensis]